MSHSATAPQPDALVLRTSAREGEIDRYIAALLAPSHLRDDLIAVAAFAAAVGHIPHAVNEPMMGELRLQWWRDTVLDDAGGATSGNPIADAMLIARKRHDLPQRLMGDAIDAVSAAFSEEGESPDGKPMQALAKFEGAIFGLTAHIHGPSAARGLDPFYEQAGLAFGMARALCGLPTAVASSWPPLPQGLTDAVVAATRDAADGTPRAPSSVFLEELAEAQAISRTALTDIRRHIGHLPPSAIAALSPLVMVEPYLEAQSHDASTLLSARVEVLPLRRMWRIWRAYRRRRF